ncbi:MAG: penicillin-binding protein activator LpoB [Desulfuromonadaceae bacterium]|nr:penicillin-binding protein activator LpoB [Desulfuromonadaceae bacterium]MDD5106500.1 penicillin-binding protein activator LpoB [Desulfuromonadaceae bacterium]
MKNGIGKLLMMVAVAALFISGCASTIQYGDAGSSKPVSKEFGSSDLQQIAEAMVDSMITFPPMVELTSGRRPVVSVDNVKNKSMQHIDTESITDSIRAKLIRSGKFRFIDRTTDAQAVEELKTQNDSGLVDKNKAVAFGQQFGAEFLLTSNFSEIRQKAGNTTDVYYKFTMSLKNLKTGILEWSDEKEIRKVFTRGTFGG